MESLLIQLAEIELQSTDPTMSHSDQKLLDDAWADINDQIEEMENSTAREVEMMTLELRDEWEAKERARIAAGGGGDPTCFCCGREGHWAATCTYGPTDPNDWEDTRDCSRCAGCAYCRGDGGGYDGTDEV